MAMSTITAATLTRASKRLKDLASDAVSIPSRQELYARRVIELHAARKRLNDFIEHQIKIESDENCRVATKDRLRAEKVPLLADVDRLERESAALYDPPPPELTPMQQARLAFFGAGLPAPEPNGGTPEQIKAARDEVDRLVRRELQGRVNGRAWNQPDPKEAAELATLVLRCRCLKAPIRRGA